MLHVLWGKNYERRVATLNQLLNRWRTGDTSYYRFSGDDFSLGEFLNIMLSSSLFGVKDVVVLTMLAEEQLVAVFSELSQIDITEKMVIVTVDELSKDVQKIIPEKTEIIEFTDIESTVDRAPVFKLIDMIASKDKKGTWLLYRKFIDDGIDPIHDIYGLFMWWIKTVRTVQDDNSKSYGLKPYVLNKAKLAAKRFSEEELRELSMALFGLFLGRVEGDDIESELERILLNIK